MDLNARKSLALVLLAAFGVGFSRPTSAQELVYTFNNAVFSDSATATGSFTFDPVQHIFGAVNITTTAGSSFSGTFPGFHYQSSGGFGTYDGNETFTFMTPAAGGGNDAFIVSLTNSDPGAPTTPTVPGNYHIFTINDGLTDAHTSREEFTQPSAGTATRYFVGGNVSVTASAAPEPSEWAALGFTGLGIGGLLLKAHKRRLAQ